MNLGTEVLFDRLVNYFGLAIRLWMIHHRHLQRGSAFVKKFLLETAKKYFHDQRPLSSARHEAERLL